MVCGDCKDLSRRTTSDKLLHDKAFNIAKNPKFDGYQHGLSSVVYEFFHKILLVLLLTQGQKLILKTNN